MLETCVFIPTNAKCGDTLFNKILIEIRKKKNYDGNNDNTEMFEMKTKDQDEFHKNVASRIKKGKSFYVKNGSLYI